MEKEVNESKFDDIGVEENYLELQEESMKLEEENLRLSKQLNELKLSSKRIQSELKAKCEIADFKLLEVAIKSNDQETCKNLLKKAKNKNPKDNSGNTLLHVAVDEGNTEILKIIMDMVKDKNPKDDRGFTPLHSAALSGHTGGFF